MNNNKKTKRISAIIILFLFIAVCSFAQNKLEIEFKTGDDDLAVRDASIQSNLNVKINYKNSTTPIVLQNINKNQNWPKHSIRKINVPLPNDVDVNNLASIEIYRTANSNIIDDLSADNWDLQGVTVFATIKNNNVTQKYSLFLRSGSPLHRFKGGVHCDCHETYTFAAPQLVNGQIKKTPIPASQNKTTINVFIGTGGDDLRGGGDNAKIVIVFKNTTTKLIFNNINNGVAQGNFTSNNFTKTLPSIANVTIADIKEVQLWHTGGGGMGADNWDVDKFQLSITINDVQKNLIVDRAGAPLHRFTGDTRRKTFMVE